MWLPKDERNLIQGYWKLIGDITSEKVYEDNSLIPLLASPKNYTQVNEYGKSKSTEDSTVKDHEELKSSIKQLFSDKSRITIANKLLDARGLITLRHHQSVDNVILVRLTPDGYDLGRRYASKIEKSGLWFAHYREHWIWLLLSFLGGVIGSIIIAMITND